MLEMSRKKGAVCVAAFVCSLLFLSATAFSQTERETESGDVLWQIIKVVEENNPILKSQRTLIETIKQAPEPGAGFINLEELRSKTGKVGEQGTQAPLLTLSEVIQVDEFVQRKLDREETLAEAEQEYEMLKESLISTLMTKIIEIVKLKNRLDNFEELKSFLEERRDSLQKQVNVGIKEPSTLNVVLERLIQISLEVRNATGEREILRLETAISLGGQKWQDILILLNKV